MKPFKDINEVVQYVENFTGHTADLKLPVCDSLIDPVGINMAVITDKILDKGWQPDGFEEKEGYRIYWYKNLDG